MKELIWVELYKMRKRKCFFTVLAFNGISLLYGMGIFFNWSWVSFNGTFDIIQYIGAIWQLLFLIGLPLIFFMYIGSSILGGEKAEGQILLEITRVANRKRLVTAKIFATVILILFYFATNVIISLFSYILLVRQTSYVTSEWIILSNDNIELLITCLFGCVYIIISVFVAMYISIRYSTVIATIAGTALYAIMSLMARIPNICMCVPGYFALSEKANIEMVSILQQILLCGVLIWGIFYLIKKEMCSLDL